MPHLERVLSDIKDRFGRTAYAAQGALLAAKVLDAQEAKALAEKAAYEAERKTPVLLLRDAWPVADERHNAGEIINVPIDIAKKWFEAGVAVRADPLPGE